MAKKVIVVDDDLFIRELYIEIIKDAGYDVDFATNGVDALEKLSKGGYDIILLDVMMPKMDGLQVLEELSKNPPHIKNGPAILMTNLSEDPLLNNPASKLASAFLIKADVTPDQIIAKTKELLGDA